MATDNLLASACVAEWQQQVDDELCRTVESHAPLNVRLGSEAEKVAPATESPI